MGHNVASNAERHNKNTAVVSAMYPEPRDP